MMAVCFFGQKKLCNMIKRVGKREIFKTKLFSINDIDLQIDEENKVTFQIIEKKDTALIVPINNTGEVFLIKEYFAAIDSYQISLPKGRIENELNAFETANKELQEEIGFKASKIIHLATFTMSPGYLTQKTFVFLAQDLKESKLPGDEVEKPLISTYPLSQIEKLIAEEEITEARVIAALFLAKNFLNKESKCT